MFPLIVECCFYLCSGLFINAMIIALKYLADRKTRSILSFSTTIVPCCLFFPEQLNTISYYFPRDTIPLVPSSVLSYLLCTYGALLQLYTKTISHTGTTSSSAEGCQDGWRWRRLDWKQLKQKGNWNTKLHLRCSGPHWLIKPNAVKRVWGSVVGCRTPLELWQRGVQMTTRFIQHQQVKCAEKCVCV